jgi:hypothetical protein
VKPAEVSTEDASLGPVSERLMFEPSLTEAGALKVAVGATLATVTAAADAADEAPWLSVTVRETV